MACVKAGMGACVRGHTCTAMSVCARACATRGRDACVHVCTCNRTCARACVHVRVQAQQAHHAHVHIVHVQQRVCGTHPSLLVAVEPLADGRHGPPLDVTRLPQDVQHEVAATTQPRHISI
eukprot:102732-Rhodomonas_salina.1